MRILLIEDDEVIAERIKAGLERARFTVDVAFDGETGLQMARDGPYALLILDLMLPRRDGWSVCEALRLRRNPLPIPVDFNELLARVRAQPRRDQIHKSRVIQIAYLEIDPAARLVRRGGQEIVLTPREFALLEALARNEGRALSREYILER